MSDKVVSGLIGLVTRLSKPVSFSNGFSGPLRWKYRKLLVTLRCVATMFGILYIIMAISAVSTGILRDHGKDGTDSSSEFSVPEHERKFLQSTNLILLISGAAMFLFGLLGIISPLLNSFWLIGINIVTQLACSMVFLAVFVFGVIHLNTSNKNSLLALFMGYAAATGVGGVVNILLVHFIGKKQEEELAKDLARLIITDFEEENFTEGSAETGNAC